MNLTNSQNDTLKELINIGVGRAAGVLNGFLKSQINLYVPSIRLFSLKELSKETKNLGDDPVSAVRLNFSGIFNGMAAIVFPKETTSKFVDALLGEKTSGSDLDEMGIGAITEVGNIVLNGVMGTISNMLKQHIDYNVPDYKEDTIRKLIVVKNPIPDASILLVEARFTIEKLQIDGNVILFFEMDSFDKLLTAIDNYS